MIRLRLFGDVTLSAADGSPVDLPTRKDIALLAYLGLSHGPVDRARALGLLWGDRGEEQARRSLRQSLVGLRKVLNQETEIVPVARSQVLSLNREGLWIDAVEFERRARAGDDAGAAELYGGPLLADFRAPTAEFEDWLAIERTRLADLAAAALTNAGRAHLQMQNWADAEAAARRAIAGNPLNEAGHRLLLRALDGAGRRNDALAHFGHLKSVLRDQLDVRPDPETEALVQAIRQPARPSGPAAPMPEPARTEAPRPGMIVLPLSFVESGQEDALLADSLTEELIASLAAYRWFFVTSANQSAIYRGRKVDPRQLHADLGVRYVLAGVLRRAGNGVAIRLDLSDPVSGQHLWSERLKCNLDEVLLAQDDLARTIASAIEPELLRAEDEVSLRNPLQDFSRWVRLARARRLAERGDPQGLNAGVELAEEAVRANRDCGHAQATLGYTACWKFSITGVREGGFETDSDLAAAGIAAAKEATRIDSRNYLARHALGAWYTRLGDYDQAIPALRRSIDLNPSFPMNYNMLTSAMTRSGRPRDALEQIDPLDQISPKDLFRGYYCCVRALPSFCLGDDDTAIANAEESLRAHETWLSSELILTAAARRRGDHDRSRRAAERLISSRGRMTREQLFNIFPLRREADFESMAGQLSDAGVLDA